jgi:hypothetical protein
MPIGKTETVSSMPGKVYNFDPSIVRDQMDSIQKEKEMLRGILEGQYDEFADKDFLEAEAGKLKDAIARRKMTLDVYSKDQGYRDLIHAEDPVRVVKGETTTGTNPSRINLPGKDSAEYKDYMAKIKAADKMFKEKQAQAKAKKVMDAVEGFKAFDDYGNDLTKFPGGPDGPLAKKARAAAIVYGADVDSLPGEGNGFQRLKRMYQEVKNPSRELVKFNPKEAVIDVKATPVKSKATGLGKYASGIVGGLVRGIAEMPKYEFLNPMWAGPSDPEDPVNQFERERITEKEFNRLMGLGK